MIWISFLSSRVFQLIQFYFFSIFHRCHCHTDFIYIDVTNKRLLYIYETLRNSRLEKFTQWERTTTFSGYFTSFSSSKSLSSRLHRGEYMIFVISNFIEMISEHNFHFFSFVLFFTYLISFFFCFLGVCRVSVIQENYKYYQTKEKTKKYLQPNSHST